MRAIHAFGVKPQRRRTAAIRRSLRASSHFGSCGPESFGNAINVRGEVAGLSRLDDRPFNYAAFLYTGGKMYDLNSLVVSGLDGLWLDEAIAINDHGQIAARGSSRTGGYVAFRLDPIPVPAAPAIEYHHTAFDHNFVTADPDEIAKLDGGAFVGWSRTGESFNVYVDAPVRTAYACRFFSTAFGPKSTHFYTIDADECFKVRANRDWQFETVAFNAAPPDADGLCPANTQPVFRLYNNGQGGAPNHRLTASLDTRSKMMASGGVPEGAGALGVGMCSPQ